jgi:hypothetical protein
MQRPGINWIPAFRGGPPRAMKGRSYAGQAQMTRLRPRGYAEQAEDGRETKKNIQH